MVEEKERSEWQRLSFWCALYANSVKGEDDDPSEPDNFNPFAQIDAEADEPQYTPEDRRRNMRLLGRLLKATPKRVRFYEETLPDGRKVIKQEELPDEPAKTDK